MKVVFDANVFISFLISPGQTITKLFQLWKGKEFVLLVNEEIMTEIGETLTKCIVKGLVDENKASALMRRIREESVFMPTISTVNKSLDKKDNRYLACSKDGRADFLVSGDKKHLLPLKKFEKTKIISPKEFVNILKTVQK